MRASLCISIAFVVGCSFDAGGVATGSHSGGLDTGAGSTAASADDTSTGAVEGSGSASNGATTQPATTAGDSSTAAVDSGGPATTEGSDTMDPSQGSMTGGTGEVAHLQHGSHATCMNPMWCIGAGGLFDPMGGPHAGQECFVAPFAPSQITAIQYSVGGVAPQLMSFALEVYAATNGQPAMMIAMLPMDAGDATVGAHQVMLDTPIHLDTTEVCVGFRTTGFGLDGALGFASSEDSQDVGESWFTSDACGYPTWSDIVAIAAPPKGNWCISADIESTD